jgi:hypothetical protein
VKAQQALPFDRLKLISLPIPARFDTQTEFKMSQRWLNKFSDQLQTIYNDWLPLSVDRRKFLELTKIPYVSYFSFGETLPVIEQGVNDPSGLGYAYETMSALIANNFNSIEYLLDNRDEFINMAVKSELPKARKEKFPKDTVNVFISYSHKDRKYKDELMAHLSVLQRKGAVTFWSDEKMVVGMHMEDTIRGRLNNSQIVLLLISANYLASDFILNVEMKYVSQLADKKDKLVIPIILSPAAWEKINFLSKRKVLPDGGRPLATYTKAGRDKVFAEIVKEIEKSILYIKSKSR